MQTGIGSPHARLPAVEQPRAAHCGGVYAVVAVGEGRAEIDSRIRFLGAPAGYEFMSLVQAVLLVGGRASILTEDNRKRISGVDRPIAIRVFTTPT